MQRHTGRCGGRASAIVAVIILIVAGVGAWYVFLRSTPEKTVRQFMDAMEANDTEKAKPLLSAKSQEAMERPFSMMRGMTPPKGEDAPESDWTLGKTEIKGDTATVPMTVKIPEELSALFGKGEITMKWGLVKEKGKWRIDMEETTKATAGGIFGM